MNSQTLGIDIPVDEAEDGMYIIRHATLERVLMDYSERFTVQTKPIAVRPEMVVVECTITDNETGKRAFKVGESSPRTLTSEISRNYPAILAYQRAMDRAAILILGLESHKVYSNMELPDAKLKTDTSHRNTTTEEQQTQPPVNKKTAPTQTAKPKAEPAKEKASNAVVDDDTVILIGSCKGKKLGEVKGTEPFERFLNWVAHTVTGYPDAARNEQLKFFKNYKEAC